MVLLGWTDDLLGDNWYSQNILPYIWSLTSNKLLLIKMCNGMKNGSIIGKLFYPFWLTFRENVQQIKGLQLIYKSEWVIVV